MRKFLILTSIAIVCIFAIASAGSASKIKPNADAVPTASNFYGFDLIEFGASGLTPGDQYEGTVEFYPDDATARHVQDSGSVGTVGDDGYVEFKFPEKFITRGLPGTLEMKVTLPDQGYDADPINTPFGPAETTIHVP